MVILCMLSAFEARSFVYCNQPDRSLETNHTWTLPTLSACLNFSTKHVLVPHAGCYSSMTFTTSSPDWMSYVFTVILLSSVRTGHPWQTCQFWRSLVNANRAACCWALSRGPTRGYRSIFYPSGFSSLKFGLTHVRRVIASASSPTCTKVQIPVGLMFSYRRVSGHSFDIA